jgi:hypothetical protein
MNAVSPPHTYSEWAELLDRFSHGDDGVLDVMRCGSIEWSAVVAERWTVRLHDALACRLRELSSRLQVGLDRAAGDTFAISGAIVGARRSLGRIAPLADLPCLTPDLRRHLGDEVRRFASQTQQQLEESAQRLRDDRGRVLKALRDNPLSVPEPPPEVAAASPAPGGPAPGRRVLL